MKKQEYFRMEKVANDSADIYIEGEIVGQKWSDSDTSAKSFRDGLKELGNVKSLNVHVNSPGGSVFDGIAIYNMLKQHSAKVNIYVDGLAASIASVIAMSGDTIFMPSNSMMMIHQPWSFAMGNAKEMRKMAETLDSIAQSSIVTYLGKTGDKLTKDKLVEMMDEETWLTADEALEYGFADEVLDPVEIAASISPDLFKQFSNVPEFLLKKKTDDDDKDDPDTDSDDSDAEPDDDDPKKKPNKKKAAPKKKKPSSEETNVITNSQKIAQQLKEMYEHA